MAMILSRRDLMCLLAGTAGLAAAGRPFGAGATTMPRTLQVAMSPMGNPGGDWSRFTEATGWSVAPVTISDEPNAIKQLLRAELKAGGGLDLLHSTGGLAETLVTHELIDPIDRERLQNWADNDYIQTFFKDDGPGYPFISAGPYLYAVPTMLQGDSFAYLPELTGKLDSYAALFDPEWRGKVALENKVETAGHKTALYLKASGLASIDDPSNMTPGEIRLVVDYLIEQKSLGQFRALWTGFDEALRLMVDKEVAVIDCWEPMVAAASARGVNAVYAAPVEGYLLWAMTASIVREPDRSKESRQAVYSLIDFMLSGWFGATAGLLRGYMTNPKALTYVEEHPEEFTPDERVKIQALDSAGRLKFQKGGVWRNRWPEHRKAYEAEWARFQIA